jgi:FlaA1/EpsC-like NDP-sugar epimerase
MVCVAGVLAFLGFLAVRYRERLLSALAWRLLSRLEGERGLGERVLVVGAGDCGLLACGLLRSSKLSSAFTVAGIVDDDPRKAGMLVDGYRVFGLTRRIPELVAQMDIGVILYAIESIRADEKKRIRDLCRRTPARVILVPNLLATFREQLTQSLPGVVRAAGTAASLPGSFGIRRDS